MKPQNAKSYFGAAVVFTALLSCSLPPPKYVNIEDHGKIALVSFSMNRSIVGTGQEKDRGPGLLQKSKKYYSGHEESLDVLWTKFRDEIGDVFLNVPFVDFDEVTSNEKYQELTKHKPKMIMGKDVAPGSDQMSPEEINYISVYDKKKLDSVAAIFGVELLLLIENQMGYDSSSAIISIKTSHLNLNTKIHLYKPGEGVIMSGSFEGKSDERISLLAGEAKSEDFAGCTSSAAQKVLVRMKEYIIKQKENAITAGDPI